MREILLLIVTFATGSVYAASDTPSEIRYLISHPPEKRILMMPLPEINADEAALVARAQALPSNAAKDLVSMMRSGEFNSSESRTHATGLLVWLFRTHGASEELKEEARIILRRWLKDAGQDTATMQPYAFSRFFEEFGTREDVVLYDEIYNDKSPRSLQGLSSRVISTLEKRLSIPERELRVPKTVSPHSLPDQSLAYSNPNSAEQGQQTAHPVEEAARVRSVFWLGCGVALSGIVILCVFLYRKNGARKV